MAAAQAVQDADAGLQEEVSCAKQERSKRKALHCSALSQDDGGPLPIVELEKHGINASDVKKLQEVGMYTVEAVSRVACLAGNGSKSAQRQPVLRRWHMQPRRPYWP